MFDSAVFWPQLKAAGMLKTATIFPNTPDQCDIDVGYDQPGAVDLGGKVGVVAFQIEFQTADAPNLRRESHVLIGDNLYKCNGFFSTVTLGKVK
jgi:hypothetical protein